MNDVNTLIFVLFMVILLGVNIIMTRRIIHLEEWRNSMQQTELEILLYTIDKDQATLAAEISGLYPIRPTIKNHRKDT